MKKLGVIIGRFQSHDLHSGHKHLINYSHNENDHTLILIGVSEFQYTEKNPLSYENRKWMISSYFNELTDFPPSRFTIDFINDNPCDFQWSKNVDDKISSISHMTYYTHHRFGEITMYCSRDGFNSSYHGKYKVKEINPYEEFHQITREFYTPCSSDYRKKITYENSREFRAGVVFSTQQLAKYPKVYYIVDAAITRENEVLLCRKYNSDKWMFIGGFYDPRYDKSPENAIIREVHEETGLIVKNPKHIATMPVLDWRIKCENEGCITSFYSFKLTDNQIGIANDDIEEVKWFNMDANLISEIAECHLPLYSILTRTV
jgi:bifunctional NMN adenylyltransferase/nudix hydrolase